MFCGGSVKAFWKEDVLAETQGGLGWSQGRGGIKQILGKCLLLYMERTVDR